MKIVLDTNVLVAGLLSPFGPCAQIVRMVSSGDLTLCLDARLLSEYDEVLHRPKFAFRPDKIAALLDYIEHSGILTASGPLPEALPDPNDQPFIEVAVAGQATCLITGNHAHFPTQRCQGVTVLSPSDFLAFYSQHQKNP
jgi:uncharacterized protein